MSARVSSIRHLPSRSFDLAHLHVHYQAQVCLHTQQVVAVEALMHYDDPQYGRIGAQEVLRLAAEACGVAALTAHILVMALEHASGWRRTSEGRQLRLGVNLSMPQVSDDRLGERIAAALDVTSCPHTCIEVELSERDVARLAAPVDTLAALKAVGVRLSLDDFGHGYLSRDLLQRLPLDVLKIDKAFIDPIGDVPEGGATARSVIELAHGLGFTVTAEGVETTDQLSFLQAHGCDRVQGYLMSRPLDADAFSRLLHRRSSEHA